MDSINWGEMDFDERLMAAAGYSKLIMLIEQTVDMCKEFAFAVTDTIHSDALALSQAYWMKMIPQFERMKGDIENYDPRSVIGAIQLVCVGILETYEGRYSNANEWAVINSAKTLLQSVQDLPSNYEIPDSCRQ